MLAKTFIFCRLKNVVRLETSSQLAKPRLQGLYFFLLCCIGRAVPPKESVCVCVCQRGGGGGRGRERERGRERKRERETHIHTRIHTHTFSLRFHSCFCCCCLFINSIQLPSPECVRVPTRKVSCLFVCLCVRWNKTRKSFSASCDWEGSKPPGNGVCVCVALFYSTDIGELLCTVPGLHREPAKGDAPTIQDRRRPNLTLSPVR